MRVHFGSRKLALTAAMQPPDPQSPPLLRDSYGYRGDINLLAAKRRRARQTHPGKRSKP